MEGTVTIHDRIGRDRLAAAVEPLSVEQALSVLEAAVRDAARECLRRVDVDVEVTLCTDAEMVRLNFDHMGERGPTDVLAFPLHSWTINGGRSHLDDEEVANPPGRSLMLGDVVVDVDQAVRQAVEGGWSVAEEIALLAVHGTLHLLGHDHVELDEEAAMRAAERHVLAALHRQHREVAWSPVSLFDRGGHAVTAGS